MSTRAALQRKRQSERDDHTAPEIVHEALHSPGQQLDEATRAFMEPRFGYDFSGVRIHTDETAAQSAEAVKAYAYTVGRDVVFGSGQYQPGSKSGKQLIAHELTHVVQQNQGSMLGQSVKTGLVVSRSSDASERFAVKTALDVTNGSPTLPGYPLQIHSDTSTPQLQREPTEEAAETEQSNNLTGGRSVHVAYPVSVPDGLTRQSYQYIHHRSGGWATVYPVDILVFQFENPANNGLIRASVTISNDYGGESVFGRGFVDLTSQQSGLIQFSGFGSTSYKYAVRYDMEVMNIAEPDQNLAQPVSWSIYG